MERGQTTPPAELAAAKPLLGARISLLATIGAVWGPGLLVMLADTDAGNVVTAAQAGSVWGFRLAPVLLLRHPAVQEAAIVGLPDEKWGETPHAFVVLREGANATEAEIIALARERLAHFKAPRAVTFVDELPKTATGKIQKFVLRKGAPNLTHQ